MKKLSVLVFAITLLMVLAPVIGINVVPCVSSSNLQPLSTRLGMAVNFTQNLFNSEIGLCRETLVEQNEIITASNGSVYQCYTNETYWIASDNYLESLALSSYNMTLSGLINQTCGKYYNGSYLPYQIMQGEAIPTTLHLPNTYVLENTLDHVIALNLYNGTVNSSNCLDYPSYGDALVYEALNYYVQGYPLSWSDNLYMHAYNMFDGKGVADAHFQNTSQYDNMKLALLVFGAKVLNLNVDLTAIEQQLWNAQKTSGVETGGITSLMNSSGQPIGTANGETTALTLLAYDDNLIGQIQSERNVTMPRYCIKVTFPAGNFNQTDNILTNLTAIPLLDNWSVTFNNTVQWGSPTNNPRVAMGFFSSLASKYNLSIQTVEYYNGVMDVVIHDASNGNGLKVTSMSWSNPLTISLISGVFSVSSSAGTFNYSFPSFPLAYITAGSTEVDVCYGGEVDVQTPPSPNVTVSPSSWNMDVDQSKNFTATASGGSGSYSSYQWYVNGSAQVGQTASTFSYSPSSAGYPTITVTVTDSWGWNSTQSSAPSVTVATSPTVSIAPAGPLSLDVGQSQTFTATRSGGSGTIHYQWYSDGGAVGTDSSTYSYTAAGTSHSVTCNVTDSASVPVTSPASKPVTITVNPPPSVTVSPPSWTMDVNQSETFIAYGSGGSGTLSYQWYLGGSAVSGKTGTSYTFNATSAGSPTIYAKVTDQASSPVTVQSNTSSVTVNAALAAPNVTANPSTVNQGSASNLTSTAVTTGTSPCTYQWLEEAPGASSYSPISGATSYSYSFATSGSTTTGTWYFELQVNDSASSKVMVTSLPTSVMVTPVIPEIPPLSLLIVLIVGLTVLIVGASVVVLYKKKFKPKKYRK
jgi:hypothetical protein